MQPHLDHQQSTAEPAQQRRRQVALSVAALGILGVASFGAYVTDGESRGAPSAEASMEPTTTAVADSSITIEVPDLAIADPAQNADEASTAVEQERADGGCTIGALSLRFGATGDGVRCLQEALGASGVYTGEASGSFDDATVRAVMTFQTAENLFVDGVVGQRERDRTRHLARRRILRRSHPTTTGRSNRPLGRGAVTCGVGRRRCSTIARRLRNRPTRRVRPRWATRVGDQR